MFENSRASLTLGLFLLALCFNGFPQLFQLLDIVLSAGSKCRFHLPFVLYSGFVCSTDDLTLFVVLTPTYSKILSAVVSLFSVT